MLWKASWQIEYFAAERRSVDWIVVGIDWGEVTLVAAFL